LVVAGTVAGVSAVGGGASPAEGQEAVVSNVVAGNFAGDGRDESFFYVSGSTEDDMISWSNGGVPGGDLTTAVFPFAVGARYDPFAGDFDGDGFDEIFWYAPGSATDSMWNFPSFTTRTSVPESVSGTYTPLVGDFNGDGIDDVFWYAPGSAADSLWTFHAGGSHTATPMQVSGTYKPVVASVGKDATDDIMWYAPGSASDTLWDFTAGTTNHTASPLPVSGNYRAFALDMFGDGPRGDDFYWYAPGPGTDTVWDYIDGARNDTFQLPIKGNYLPIVGDYFADGQQDVLLVGLESSALTLRDFTTSTTGAPIFVDYNFRETAALGAAAQSHAKVAAAGEAHALRR
jgi:hypothetical protein